MDYVAFGNDELDKMPRASAGDAIQCPHCDGLHELEPSDPPMLLFYRCGPSTFLAGVNGRLVMSRLDGGVE